MTWGRRTAAVAGLFLIPLTAAAHPLGNFTTNQYLGVHVEPHLLTLDYVLDLAEVPASQQVRVIDADGDEELTTAEEEAFATSECKRLGVGLAVTVDERAAPIEAGEGRLTLPEGEAGLPTLRLECRFASPLDVGTSSRLVVGNVNFADRTGWREMTLTTTGVDAQTGLPSQSSTGRLSEYPQDLLSSPVEKSSGVAVLSLEPGARIGAPPPPVGAESIRTGTPVDALAALIDPGAGSPAVPIAMAVAVGLGILHALAPGHGKTVMAAYLVGSRGTMGQAVGLGFAVAIAHTIGVLVLGVITLLGTSTFAPERVFPVLSLASGVIVTSIGSWMLFKWIRQRRSPHAHDHTHDDHEHGVGHTAHGSGHSHVVPHALDGQPGWKVLASMGLAGGLVPSISAIVLLLAAVNLGRVPLGLLLITLFGVGMAATLVGVGFALVTASRFGMDRLGGFGWVDRARRLLTPVAALVVMVVGGFLSIGSV